MEELRARLRAAAVRPQGRVGRRLRQARQPRAERRRVRRTRSCPPSADAIAQELFVFELSDDGRRELARMVASDYSRAQISVKLASMSSDLVFEQINRAEAGGDGGLRRQRHHADGHRIRPHLRDARSLPRRVAVEQLRHRIRDGVRGDLRRVPVGTVRAARRSSRTRCRSCAVLGLMGWLGISLNVATVMVASVALGIVDDDTIHFIGRFRREAARRGHDRARPSSWRPCTRAAHR